MSSTQSDWANLPKNIIDVIVKKSVPPLSQYVFFTSVCKSWRTAVIENSALCKIISNGHNQVPFLMIPIKDKDKVRLYNFLEGKMLNLELRVPCNHKIRGSSHGWLATVQIGLKIKLINPFTDDFINLPSVNPDYWQYFEEAKDGMDYYQLHIRKVILSDDSNRNPNDYLVVVIFNDDMSIGIFKVGDKTWTYPKRATKYGLQMRDVIFNHGDLFAVQHYHTIITVKIESCNWAKSELQEEIIAPLMSHCDFSAQYIVKSTLGEILVIHRIFKHYGKTKTFKIYKLIPSVSTSTMSKLVEITDLGNQAIFLGDNYSTSFVASDLNHCQPNCIYFADDDVGISSYPNGDIGIFSLKHKCLRRHYISKSFLKNVPYPLWVFPTLQRSLT